jgi:hypothetical protein
MYRITGSVGTGGRNAHDDVQVVQKLLLKNAHLVPEIGAVPQDGNLDDVTQAAILAFQKRIVGLSSPDGRVDPRGRTFRILQGEQPQAATVILTKFSSADSGGALYSYENQDRQYGTPATLDVVATMGRAFLAAGLQVGIGDISFMHGGRMPPHESHRRGVDVDLRLQRTDGAHVGVTIHDKEYSRDNTRKVVEVVLAQPSTTLVLNNDSQIKGVRPWPGHDNHIHVRFKE